MTACKISQTLWERYQRLESRLSYRLRDNHRAFTRTHAPVQAVDCRVGTTRVSLRAALGACCPGPRRDICQAASETLGAGPTSVLFHCWHLFEHHRAA